MQSFKNWQLVNESYFSNMNLGLSHPQSLGLQSNLPGLSLTEKKKMHGDVVADDDDDDCSCKHKEKDNDEEDEFEKGDEVKFSKKKMKKNMKKKMKKHMDGDMGDDEHDDDVNNVKTPVDHDDEDDHDEDHDDEDDHDDDEHDDLEHDDEEGDFDDEEEEHDDEDEGDDAPKFGFMKDKKKKKNCGKKMKEESSFWGDIDANYKVPKDSMDTEEEFFESLARQYGNPSIRHNGGVDAVNEDLLLSPEQQALIDAMPAPGEAGYSPYQRIGGFSDDYEDDNYGENAENEEPIEESTDYEVLCKYFSEDAAYGLIAKKRRK